MIPPLSEDTVSALLQEACEDDFFVFLESTRITLADRYSYLFRKPLAKLVLHGADSPADFFAAVEDHLAKGHYLAGWFAYEYGYLLEPALVDLLSGIDADKPLAELGVFAEPCIFDHLSGEFLAGTPWPLAAPGGRGDDFRLANLRLSEEKEQYLRNIAAIKGYIESGDTYQVNYTLKMFFDYGGDGADFYTLLRRNQRVAYGAMLKSGARQMLSFSPELFFRKDGAYCQVKPMKGTVGRGRNRQEDRELGSFLRNDIKNRSENVMIVDLLRNDLGRLCMPGAVEVTSLFDVEAFETLQQMTSSIRGTLVNGVGLHDIFRAIYPCGSVTGAPKIRTMEIIRALEGGDRGIYTGAIGFFSPHGQACFNVPIRTVVLEDGKGEMGIGSGIVYDSEAESEWAECLLKGDFLTRKAPVFDLIETILWQRQGGFYLLSFHLERLLSSAAHFRYAVRPEALEKELAQIGDGLLDQGGDACRVRLLLNRQGDVSITTTPCTPLGKESFMLQGQEVEPVRIKLADKPTSSSSMYLYHKTSNRELYNREREIALEEGYFEVIFVNERGEITEGSITNIFARFGNIIKTPPQSCGLLAGVFRRYIIENLTKGEGTAGMKIEEAILTPTDLQRADQLFIANSVRGLIEARLSRSNQTA